MKLLAMKTFHKLGLIFLSALILTACSTTVHQYAGEPRPANEIASVVSGMVIPGKSDHPDMVLSLWRIDGSAPKNSVGVTRYYGVLPGNHEIGVILALVNPFPATVRRFEGTYWIPFEAEPGYFYQLYAKHNGDSVPSQVCALRVAKENFPIHIPEGMAIPGQAKIVGCGSPKKPVEDYELSKCNYPGSCHLSDEFIKP